jgi:hypothetical protein
VYAPHVKKHRHPARWWLVSTPSLPVHSATIHCHRATHSLCPNNLSVHLANIDNHRTAHSPCLSLHVHMKPTIHNHHATQRTHTTPTISRCALCQPPQPSRNTLTLPTLRGCVHCTIPHCCRTTLTHSTARPRCARRHPPLLPFVRVTAARVGHVQVSELHVTDRVRLLAQPHQPTDAIREQSGWLANGTPHEQCAPRPPML